VNVRKRWTLAVVAVICSVACSACDTSNTGNPSARSDRSNEVVCADLSTYLSSASVFIGNSSETKPSHPSGPTPTAIAVLVKRLSAHGPVATNRSLVNEASMLILDNRRGSSVGFIKQTEAMKRTCHALGIAVSG